jgi:pyrroline-5-carboxylate reductase
MDDARNISDKVLGFIGCGKISSAICRGFASHPDSAQRPRKILVSRRNEEKSETLRKEFPDLVVIIDSNEEIVRESNIVFIGLLPMAAREVLPTLPFTNQHLMISMMAAVDFETTQSLLSNPELCFVRIVPLPSSSRRSGPILMYPSHTKAFNILSVVGTPIVCTTESEMKPMISVTGHISSFYELMRTTENFITDHGTKSKKSENFSPQSFLYFVGISSSTAHAFVTSFYASLATGAEKSAESLEGEWSN